MQEQTYAIVVYLHGPLAQFVNKLRAQLNPTPAGKAAHVTVLPPRPLIISEGAALEEARARCAGWEPFEMEVTGVGTFYPTNGVVYLEIERGAEEMKRLHVALNKGHLLRCEPYEFVPHITIAQEMDEARTQEVLARVSHEFANYSGPLRFLVETLVFVRQTPSGDWVDLADLELGRAQVPAQ